MTDTPTPVIPTKVGTQGDKDPADTGSRPVQAMTDDELAETYLKLADAREGMKVVVDGGFTCMAEGEEKVIKRWPNGDLYVDCAEGGHGLCGQLDVDDALIGIFPLDGALCK